MDTEYAFAPDAGQRWKDIQKLFHTRDEKEAFEIIDKYNIKYIWIDNYFKNQIWSYNEDGLLFILKYSPSFKLIYNQDNVMIWKVIAKEKSLNTF